MANYQPIERKISNILSKFPFAKNIVKAIYARLVFLRFKKSFTHQVNYRLATFGGSESFFGYYDKSPVNSKGSILLHLAENDTRKLPSRDQKIQIALSSPDMTRIIWSTNTAAYNWQQGARLQWLNDHLFTFNDFDHNNQRYASFVVNSESFQITSSFDCSVQDSFRTDYFLSINYQRLMALRPDYGYRNLPASSDEELKSLSSDGIWRIDYQTGKKNLLISYENMCEFQKRPEFSGAFHKANHVMISPTGERFVFLHRFYLRQRRFDRLIMADAQTGALKLLADNDMVSHCYWADERTILGYMRGPGKKAAYWLINVVTGEFTPVASGALDAFGDGHPHVYGDWFVTDTYPDKARMQHLLLCNWKTGEIRKLGEFFHGFEFDGETRCDLHPRFSPDGNKVFFDSVFTGKRQLYMMDISL